MPSISVEFLKTINPEQVDEQTVIGWKHREAARAVVFAEKRVVGLLRVAKKDYYKLPGGGVEEGEDARDALDRECYEELGIRIEVLKEIGVIVEYRTKFKLYQTSVCFLAKALPGTSPPRLTDEERSAGFETVWVEPKEALHLLNLKRTADYEGKFIEERDLCFLGKALEVWKTLP